MEGYGKARRGRRQRAGPYSRPSQPPAPAPEEEEARELAQLAPGEPERQGLLASLLQRGASLFTKVPVLGSYFAAPASAEPPADDDEQLEEGAEQEDGLNGEAAMDAAQQLGGEDGGAAPNGLAQPQPLQPQAAAAQQRQPAAAGKAGKAAGRRVAFQSPIGEEADGAATPPPQRATPGEDSGSEPGGTPYDNVLALLRQGPLAANSPRSFPRPRSTSLLTAGAGRTPGPGLAFGASPAPAPPSGGSDQGGGAGRRGGYVGSRLGPGAGASGTPSTGIRTGLAARSGSRFSRTPVHMQPLAAGVQGGSGGAAGAGGTSRFGLAAAAAAAAGDASGSGAAGTGLLSPAPLAWTPMRSNLGAQGLSGGKRKAESASPDAGNGGNISLLDAQRRIRHKSEPAVAGMGGEGGAVPGSADRRSWRAGRTPFVKGAGLSRFGAAQQQERSVSPALPAVEAAPPAAGSKATTDTARRILATLDALDKVVAASPPGGAAAAVAAALGEPEKPSAASPPPTDSLGFAGLPRGEPAPAAEKRSVKFGGVSFAPSPTPASSPMVKPSAAEAAAPAAEPAPAAAAAPAPASGGWGEAFLAANRAAMAKATEAAKAEAEGGSKQAAAAPPAFSFGLPPPATEAPAGDTPKLKQRLLEPQAEAPAAAKPAAKETAPAPAAPLFGFAKPAAEAAQPQQAAQPQAGLFPFGQPKPAAKEAAAEPSAPKFTFGGSRSSAADRQVAAAVASASPVAAAGPAPKFEFGGKAAAKQEAAALTPPPAAKPADPFQANQAAAEAAKSPLPDSDLSDSEEPAAAAAKPAKPEKAAPASGGWDLDFLKKNQAAAKAATEAAAKEVDAAKPAGPAAGAPKFTFGASPASSSAGAPASLIPSFLVSASSAAAGGSEAAAPKFSFGAAPSSSAGAAAPLTFGASASSAPAFSFGAASSAAGAASEAPAAAISAAAATGSGWGDAFLKANQAAAAKAAEAAAKEIEAAAPGAAPASAPAAASAPAFTFGLPASGAAATTAPSAATFTFGSGPASSSAAAEPATAPATGLTFGAPSSAPAAGAAVASTPAFSFGGAAASSAAATAAPTFTFGGASSAADGQAASAPAFGFGGASSGAAAAPASTPAFAFGAASSEAAAAPASSPSFGFGASSSAAAAAPAPAPAFGFGASSSGAAAGAASAPSLGFGSSAPAAGGFAFGASQPASGAAFQFGAAAAPASAAAPAAGGFAFGSGGGGFGAANGGMESDMMDNNGGAAASSAGFQFGGASSTPAFGGGAGGGFAFGGAPASQPAFGFGSQPAAPASQPAFAFGGQPAAPASQPAFGFGGAAAPASQPAFAFGGQPAAPASQPAFGFGSQPTFGAPQQPTFGAPQQPAFGAQQPAFAFGSQQPAAPGAMVPNNPFGGGMGGGNAFSIGSSGGGSQSESGRRKLKVKRPGRKPLIACDLIWGAMTVARCALTARRVLLASRVVCALASGTSSFRAVAPIRPLVAQPRLPPAVCKRPSYSRFACSAAATDGTMVETNPLLTDSPFPAYSEVKAEHVVPGIRALLAELHAEVDKLEANVEPTWQGLVQPLERIVDRLSRAWGTVSHLKAVKDTEELRKAVEEVQPERVKLSLRLSQSKPLYEAFKAIKDGAQWAQLTEAQQRIVDGELRDFVLGGVALEGEAKERFNEIQQELSQLSTKFSNNVLDATKAYKKLLTDKADVEGLPESALALAAQQAAKEGHEGATPESGPWLFTLDFPSYFPVMTHAKNRALREEMYRQSITRASSGDIDNTPIIEKVLALRQEKAELLGFKNFAEVSMASKMATLEKAEELLEQLRAASYDAATRDLQDIKEFAAEQGFTEELQQWDVSYWAERLKEAKYALEEEQLRPYFALPNVLEGLFGLAKRLFDVDIEPADGQVPVWHEDVRFFCVKKAGQPKAFFYLDPYSRPAEKRGGAWMDEVCGQSKLFAREGESVRLPVAHMVCNQTPPVGDKPSLMTFREVETLFHEFGHAAQHMLTEQQEGLVAGIRGVEWDAVELPSQFMENWCYDRKTLYQFAKHHATGEPLPEELYQRLLAARTYRSGSMTLRQIHFASVDLELHARFTPGKGESVFERDQAVAQRTTVMPPLPEDRFLCSFSHIFAGGYSAGYYSYKWAEVLSADAFAAFEEAGLDNEDAVAETGRRFRDTVLGLGGGRAPQLVFQDFRGREPTVDALLRHNNLLPSLEVAGAAA